ncbi:MAG TPA: hypothetical protein VFC67_13630 [Prolixibacteraceae bacterium]|nr:hypothetical protein [Prolixibacteraceae bacterium]
MKKNYSLWKLILLFILFANSSAEGQINISNRSADNVITFGNSKLKVTLDYASKCVVTGMEVNGEAVLSGKSGIYSAVRTSTDTYSTRKLATSPKIKTQKNSVTLSGIRYGEDKAPINEVWTFLITENDIRLDIERSVAKSLVAEEVSFPMINFNSIHTWDGSFLGYGGLAWFYLFNEKLCTYGVHTGSSVFWNNTTGNGLKVAASASGKQIASKFTRSGADQLVYAISVSDNEMKYRYDAGTNRRRFVRGKTDVWDSFQISAGKYAESVTFSWVNYNEEYNRGHLAGINGKQVTSLANTIARIGVIDAKHFGGNSWHTPYGPICLHEQYIGQLGIAIDDTSYTEGYKQCLNYYRDNAIQPDGRVLSRWAYTDEDAMKGTATSKGFYEAQWGYLLDSNPDFVTNVSDLYNQSGDLNWVRKFKQPCEKALAYLLKRDTNGNHLVEMMTNNESEKRGSDWIDIIWASYENAFVNAKLYYALTLWSDIEKQLGDTEKANYYSTYASELKTSFNKPTTAGGFWDETNKWYVHWLDKDKSAHGNNLMIPVNFMAITYGICDDVQRKKAILDKVEEQMQKEKLFAWPLCMYTYAKGEGNDWQFPFPNYENGDIFLSWGAIGVEAYASYKPELALKYVENILARYEKDGLAFQRYGRVKQDGLGDDILSGNSLAIIGLYKSIYGINPMYNRMYLNPHIPDKLSGTTLNYKFRGDKLVIRLDKGRYSVSNAQFMLTSANDFGFNAGKNELEYFNSSNDACSLKAQLIKAGNLSVNIVKWNENERVWNQLTHPNKGKITYSVSKLKADNKYAISINGQIFKTLKSDKEGRLEFDVNPKVDLTEIRIQLIGK